MYIGYNARQKVIGLVEDAMRFWGEEGALRRAGCAGRWCFEYRPGFKDELRVLENVVYLIDGIGTAKHHSDVC